MVRIKQCGSAVAVLRYFLESLTREEFRQVRITKEPGLWLGSLAARLGLTGAVSRESFASMLGNIHPSTGLPLTPRTKDNRRVGYEIEVSVPKSVSVLYALCGDTALLRAFVDSVTDLMSNAEQFAMTRVRRGGMDEDRPTREIAYAGFLHRMARPVNGVSDPQLHAHCIIMNATWDPAEKRTKALQFGAACEAVPLLEAQFLSALAERVIALGYRVSTKGRFWEIEGVPLSVVDKFSQRTDQIERAAEALGVVDPKERDSLGARTRERKIQEVSISAMRSEWTARLTSDELAAIFATKDRAEQQRRDAAVSTQAHVRSVKSDQRSESRSRRPGTEEAGRAREDAGIDPVVEPQEEPGAERRSRLSQKDRASVAEAIRLTAGKLFERQAVVAEQVLLDAGLRAAPGRVRIDDIREEIAAQGMFTRTLKNKVMVTTPEAVADEQRLIELAVAGKGRYKQAANTSRREYPELTTEQAVAVCHVLDSPDLVTVVEGRAGVGKSTLTRTAVPEILSRLNRPVCMLAPTAKAARGVLREEGHKHADTVTKFLTNPALQERARNGLIWVDEAGLLSTKATSEIMERAASLGARVVLVGDDRQHRSVARGDVLQTLKAHANVRCVTVEGVLRQRGAYKEVAELLNRGQGLAALEKLDAMGAVIVRPKNELFQSIAADFVAARQGGRGALMVAPTHAECREATLRVRQQLKDLGTLRNHRGAEILVSKSLTEFERKRSATYQAGDVVCFQREVGSRGRGTFDAHSRWTVLGHDPFGNVLVTKGGLSVPQALPLKRASAWDVFERRRTEFSVGDQVRFTNSAVLHSRLDWAAKLVAPSKQKPTNKVDRGEVHTITKISPKGRLMLSNGLVVPPSFGHLTHAYCVTSYAAQGMTTDIALVLHSSMSGRAASFRQFNVAVTRGRDAVRVYTDNRVALGEAVVRNDDLGSAVTLITEGADPKRQKADHRGAARRHQEMADEARRAQERQSEQQRSHDRGHTR